LTLVVDDIDNDAVIITDADAATLVFVPRLLIVVALDFVFVSVTLWSAPTPTPPPRRRLATTPRARAAPDAVDIVSGLPAVALIARRKDAREVSYDALRRAISRLSLFSALRYSSCRVRRRRT